MEQIKSNQTSEHYVYIMTNLSGTLYIGETNNLKRRIQQHKCIKGISKQKKLDRLLYFEVYDHVAEAMERKQDFRNWKRKWQENLLNEMNPDWKDLAEHWYTKQLTFIN